MPNTENKTQLTRKEQNLSTNLHKYKHILSLKTLNTLLYIIHRNLTWCFVILRHFFPKYYTYEPVDSSGHCLWYGWSGHIYNYIGVFFSLHKSLCTILYLEYFQCNDVLKDFTMRWEIISSWMCGTCLVCCVWSIHSCILTISQQQINYQK